MFSPQWQLCWCNFYTGHLHLDLVLSFVFPQHILPLNILYTLIRCYEYVYCLIICLSLLKCRLCDGRHLAYSELQKCLTQSRYSTNNWWMNGTEFVFFQRPIYIVSFFEPITSFLPKCIHLPDFCATNTVLVYMKPLRRISTFFLGFLLIYSCIHSHKYVLCVPAFLTLCQALQIHRKIRSGLALTAFTIYSGTLDKSLTIYGFRFPPP